MTRAEIIRLMYRTQFAPFAEVAFEAVYPGATLTKNWHIDVMARALGELISGSTRRLVVNLPPRSLKSFMTTIAMPAFLLGRDRRHKILILAGTSDLATDLRQKIVRLVRSERYRGIFPEVEFKEDGRSIRFSEGGLMSVLRYGESIIGRGFDIIIIDDPQSPSQVEDAEKRRQVAEYFSSDVQPRLNSKADGRIALVQQRLHSEDLSGSLWDSEWSRLIITAMSAEEETWSTAAGSITRPKWTAICEARESSENLKKLMHEMGGLKFAAQYLQRPYPAGEGELDAARMMWQPPLEGWDQQNEQMPWAFVKVSKIAELEERYFGGTPFPYVHQNPNRELTLEEWTELAQKQQAELVRRAQEVPLQT